MNGQKGNNWALIISILVVIIIGVRYYHVTKTKKYCDYIGNLKSLTENTHVQYPSYDERKFQQQKAYNETYNACMTMHGL